MMDVEDFLNKINDQNWKISVKEQTSKNFDKILDALQENKDIIIEEVIKDLKRIEDVKTEDKELFTSSDANKWMIYYIKEYIKGLL